MANVNSDLKRKYNTHAPAPVEKHNSHLTYAWNIKGYGDKIEIRKYVDENAGEEFRIRVVSSLSRDSTFFRYTLEEKI